MSKQTEVLVPDLGDIEKSDVIEVLVAPGDRVHPEDPLITLESEKAMMEVPSPASGIVKEIKIKVGDKVSQGDLILTLEASEEKPAPAAEKKETKPKKEKPAAEPAPVPGEKEPTQPPVPPQPGNHDAPEKPYASPSVHQFARELGVDLERVTGSGPNGRILKEDVQLFVKGSISGAKEAPGPCLVLPELPALDYSKYGEIESVPLSRIRIISGTNVHRSWLTVPHVTQFDEADITDLEAFRKEHAEEAKKQGYKLTLLAFIMKACVGALQKYPRFNASLDPGCEHLILKKYFNIGFAVDTEDGLLVPVLHDVDKKGLFDLARELGELSARARERRLKPADMQGGSFTISSLGGIGGTAFTPIVNAPEVAILGVSRAVMKPVYQEEVCTPRLILPFSLAYDHRAIDGADGARFVSYLRDKLSDIRNLLL